MIKKVLITLILVVGILGAGAYYGYQLLLKPRQELAKERTQAALAPVPTPTPDPAVPALEAAIAIQKTGDLVAAREAISLLITQFPDSPALPEARRLLGEVNMDALLSTYPLPNKLEYTVVKGDALAKIAGKTKADAELIMRSNNLGSINLSIGQRLLIPQMAPSIHIHRADKTLTLYDGADFVKQYPLLSASVPGAPGQKITGRVTDKTATFENKRVAFGSKEYAASDRMIILGQGMTIRGVAESADGQPKAAAFGIALPAPEMEELFLFISRGTPVTID